MSNVLELKTIAKDQVQFPNNEWKWLRLDEAYENSPDFFLWAAQFKDKLYCWSQKGGHVINLPDKVPVLFLGDQPTELECYGLYLLTSFRAVPGNEVEWINVLDVLTNFFNFKPSEENLGPQIEKALKLSRYEPHFGLLANRAKFLFLSFEEKKFLYQKNWDPQTFELFESMSEQCRSSFLKVLQNLPLSSNHVKEAANHLLIYNRKFGEKATQQYLGLNHKSAEDFRQGLLATAQPELATLTRIRIERLRNLQLPPRTSVFGDPTFEKDGVKITHTPRNIGDFTLFCDWASDEKTKFRIKELLEIHQ